MAPHPPTFSQPPEALMGSRVPPPPPDALKDVEALIARLRAEAAASTDRGRRARLLYEVAEVEERAGDEAAAARDYLAAFNAEASFREPLEALVRLLERRRSLRNLGKLIDALVRSSTTAEERARALTLRAFYVEDAAGDAEAAKAAADEATQLEAPANEAATAWLALELMAAKSGDASARARALEERARFTREPAWRALLQLDAARLVSAGGDVDRALAMMAEARREPSDAAFLVALEEERLARTEPGTAGSDEANARLRSLAAALSAQAALVGHAIDAGPDGSGGVPRWACTRAVQVDAWLRAAEALEAAGDADGAGALLDAASAATASEGGGVVSAAIVEARIRVADRAGERALSARLAEGRIAAEEDPGVAAALAVRVAEQAVADGDTARALTALGEAIARDPGCVPARALQLDLLAQGGDAAAFAGQLEAFAEQLATDDGRGRALLVAAYVWAIRAGDVDSAKGALSQASAFGVAPEVVARLSRALASVTGDAAWHEEATRRLVAAGASDDELPMLWLELARTRFARGDGEGAQAALRALGETASGGWIGRALEAFLPAADTEAARSLAALDELADRTASREVARGLRLIAAMRAQSAGDAAGAITRLRALAVGDPGDALVATYLAGLERAAEPLAAARTAETAAAATEDAELAAALHLEAGLARWRAGERAAALAAFDAANGAGRGIAAWAARGVDPDDLDARRSALARAMHASDAGGSHAPVHLERFATELAAGDASEASGALALLESDVEDGAFRVAAALARAAWSVGEEDPDAMRGALRTIAEVGDAAATMAAAEHHRLARGQSPADAVDAARAWYHAGGGGTAAVEWLAATMALGEPDEEYAARRAIGLGEGGELREALLASAAMLKSVHAPEEPGPLIVGTSDAIRLVNLELSPPGCDPRRRIAALTTLDGALGEEARLDALMLAGWSWLARGDDAAALDAFVKVTDARDDDIGAWEGLRAAAEATGNDVQRAIACERLGLLCTDDPRGAAFWEQAAFAWQAHGDEDRAEACFDASFARDAHRASAFDPLFRRVRARKDGDRLLAIVARRLEATDDPPEISKLFWEQARVLREKGDHEAALKALENVTMLEPDHVGALALTGEIAIRRGQFEEAAAALSRLALLADAPAKSRVTAGVAAVDLYENKLNRFERALEVLLALHKAKLSTLPVRERLARAAARTGSWQEATAILEELMHERAEQEGRIEAARLAMAIHRDRLNDPNGGRAAIVKLLEESPTDGEGLDMLLQTEHEPQVRRRLLDRARSGLVESLQRRPFDLPSVRRLAKVARAVNDDALQQAALSVALVLGGHDAPSEHLFAQIASRKARTPQMALGESTRRALLDPGDSGPISQLFVTLGPTLTEALGPSLAACGVGRRDRVEPRAGLPLRNEIATWAGALGIQEFELYVGGKDPLGVQGVPGEVPALVIGAGVNTPLAPATRARVARELMAVARGTTVVRSRDETTVAAIVVAACNLAEVPTEAPAYAMLADVERQMNKAIARRTKKMLPEIARAIVASGADARAWAKRAILSQCRVAIVACGDVGVVLSDLLDQPLDRLPAAAKGDPRAEELVRFMLSPTYLDLRRALGLEAQS